MCALTILLLLAPPSEPLRYRDLLGCHYTADRPDRGLARGLPLHSWGWTTEVTDRDHPGIEPYLGPFSGEPRYHDFTHHLTGRSDLFAAVRHAGERDVEVLATIGLPSPDAIQRHGLARAMVYLQDLVYRQVVTFNTGEFAAHPVRDWQLGNEINGIGHFNVRDISLAPGDSPWRQFNRPEQREAYVQQFLAPLVVAIRRASQDVYGDPRRVRIVLGSVANFYNPASGQWLEDLLTTPVTSVPELAGRQVWELVDVASFHYLVTAAPDGWRDRLDDLHARWVATGRLSGLWATEEHGANGRGAVTAARVALSWLDWWLGRPWRVGVGRVCLWGDERAKPGAPGRVGSELLHAHLGEAALRRAEPAAIEPTPAGAHEALSLATNAGSAVVAIWPRATAADLPVDAVQLPTDGGVVAVLLSNSAPPARLPVGVGAGVVRPAALLTLRADHEETLVLLQGRSASAVPELAPPTGDGPAAPIREDEAP